VARRRDAAGAILDVVVTPRASAESLGPFREGVLLVRVTRLPANGEANRAVAKLLAATFEVPVSRVVLVSGGRSRRKRFLLDGIGPAELKRRLTALAES
jgi:uncharacterized protein YggU (UPF0235/DUF167 family)